MHLYFHIPFCASKCPYCAFGSTDKEFGLVKPYFDAINFELDAFLAGAHPFFKLKNEPISTIFFGGGTPSAVKAEFYAGIFEKIQPFLSQNCEVTAEANPRSATPQWLREMRSFGLNRVSFGVQSLREDKLKLLGRRHGQKDVFDAVQNAVAAGFERVSVDVIYGTCLDSKESLKREFELLFTLPFTHLSAYSLTIEENTPFALTPHFAKDDENLARFVFDEFENHGFTQYEISNFATNLHGKLDVCRHNYAYWQGADYAGFGAFAVGTSGGLRLTSPKNAQAYIDSPLSKECENLSAQNLADERLFLGLRSAVGVEAKGLGAKRLARVQTLRDERLLRFENGRFFCKDFLLADEIFLFITQ